MRLLRLRLRHYRGIEEREIHFAPRGITVVQGPNESGKSSLAESIDLLFDELDSAAKQRVKDVKPVHRDEGAEIEAEVETGEYAFTYAKRFHRRPATSLHVERPAVENHTAREAHQRVRALLDETIDTGLWRALRIQQGEGLDQAPLGGRSALSAALDRAAGMDAGREESLLELVHAERDRYFTKTGRERPPLKQGAEALAAALEELAAAEEALHSFDDDLRRHETLRGEVAALEAGVRHTEHALREREQELEAVAALRADLARVAARRDTALAEERGARQAAKQRSQLLTAHATAEAEVGELTEALDAGRPDWVTAQGEMEHAERVFAEAREQLEASETGARRRRLERDLAELRARRRRLDETDAAADEAGRVLERVRVDELSAHEIQEAELAFERARARLEAEGPIVHVDPETDLEALVDGRRQRLRRGESSAHRLAESFQLAVAGVGELLVVAGAGADALRKQVEEAKTRLRTLCMEAGVEDHADALLALASRRDAERALEARDRLHAELLGDRTSEALDAGIARLEGRLREEGDPDAPPADADAAAAALEAADAALETARQSERAARTRRDGAASRLDRLEVHRRETRLRLDLAKRGLEGQRERLAAAREEAGDEAIETRREACAEALREAEAAVRGATRELETREPGGVERRAAEARREREQQERALRDAREEAIRLAARISALGQEGLYERCGEARGRAHRLEREHEGLQRRAAAARLLSDTLDAERDAARSGVAEPLRRRIEELGRRVFGESFGVELDDALRIEARHLDGVRLRFEQLSAGAREQLALIARCACAVLVAGEGGAPLILDDALGHSDPERLEAMARVLEHAAASCQVIVLTCTPERYARIEGARVVELT